MVDVLILFVHVVDSQCNVDSFLFRGAVLSVIVTLIQYRPMAEHGDHGNK